MTKKVALLDYGSGNVHSAAKALQASGAEVILTASRKELLEADGLVIPGVGAFAAVMEKLNAIDAGSIIDSRLVAGRPVLGICVGMQILGYSSEEGVEQGLGWIEGKNCKINFQNIHDKRLRVPHMGWNYIITNKDSNLINGLSNNKFYFLHSYHFETSNNFVSSKVDYGIKFNASIEKDNIFGVQFHPEKSH